MTLAIGVIGTGAIGRDHARRITRTLAGGRVVAVSDIDPAAARAAAEALDLDARVFATGPELIAAPEVQAVVVTSWGATHEALVLAALAAGKPVFCEKPLATTAAGAANVVRAETALGRRLVQVGFMRRYDPGYRALKAAVGDGAIGAPLVVHCAHRNVSAPAAATNAESITETFIHELDILRWLLADDYVSAQVAFPRRSRNAPPQLADPQIVLIETATGVRIDAEIFVNSRYGYDIQCEIVGETGTVRLPDPAAIVLRRDAALSTPLLTDWKERFIASYDVELQDWIAAASAGGASGPTAWDGLAAALAADACVAAQAAPGTIVPIAMPARPALYATGGFP